MAKWKATSDTRTVTVLARINDGRADDVREVLRAIDAHDSPFGALPGVHFARLMVLDRFVQQERPLILARAARIIDYVAHGWRRVPRPDAPPHPYLLFSATIDRQTPDTDTSYFELLRGMRDRADNIWGHCHQYPGHDDRAGFVEFLRERALSAGYVFAAKSRGRVDEVQRALALRQRLADFATRTQHLPDEELHEWFLRSFGELLPEPDTDNRRVAAPAPARALLTQPPPDRLELHDIQGIVLNGYPCHGAATHLFLRVRSAAAARQFLNRAARWVTTAHDAAQPRAHRPTRALHVALSRGGLAALGVPDTDLDAFGVEFRQGMYEREPMLTPDSGITTWQHPFDRPDSVQVLLLLSATTRAEVDNWAAEIRRELLANGGFDLMAEEHGDRMTNDFGGGPVRFVEHFGFADGLSRPAIAGYGPRNAAGQLPPGEFILGHRDVDSDIAGRGLPVALARNGSFLVYRKLQQHVAAFRATVATIAEDLPAQPGISRHDLAGGKLVGRLPDGTPVTFAADGAGALTADDNEFGYRHDLEGRGCPIGAHVRRANPRDALPGRTTFTRRHQMLRRGITYGKPLPVGADDDGGDRGLLFAAVVGDIGRQFEFVQAQWMADGSVFGRGYEQDAFTTAGGPGVLTIQGSPPIFARIPQPLVTCRGGEYFLLPGVSSLRALGATGAS